MAQIAIFHQEMAGGQLRWKLSPWNSFHSGEESESYENPEWSHSGSHRQILEAFLALQTVFGAKIHVLQGIV